MGRKVFASSSSTSWADALARRLDRHHLLEPADAGQMVEVVSDICGAHAQVGASAEMTVGVRVRDITRQDVRNALWRDRTLVKTVGHRGTLHLFPADELPFWLAANRLTFQSEEKRLQSVRISRDALDSVIRAIDDVVGPKPISRADLAREIEERVGGWATTMTLGWMGTHPNWAMALGWAAALGLVCYGPDEGGRSTFVRLSDWVRWRDVDPPEGGRFALRRFLQAYGPSTPAEFSRWFSLAPAITKDLFDRLADDLVEVSVEGERRWALASDAAYAGPDASHAVHLLPQFDVFVVGSHPRNQLMEDGSPIAAMRLGSAAPFSVVLRGGRVAGVWERRPKGKKLLIRIDPYWGVSRAERDALEANAMRVAAILERECLVEFGHVELRPHA